MTMVAGKKVVSKKDCKSSVILESDLGGGGLVIMEVNNIEQQESTRSSTCVDNEETAAAASSNSSYYADTTTTSSCSSSWLQLGLPNAAIQQPDNIVLDLNLAPPSSSIIIPPAALYLHPQPNTSYPLYYQFPMPMPVPSWSTGFYNNNNNNTLHHAAPPIPATFNSSFDFKLIHPSPSRPHSGLWFTLLPWLPQLMEPCLPPLSKKFLRIKDERMTVGLVIKYVTNKLGLDSESQIEIRCRGQVLEGFLTLKDVRDKIWNTSQAVTTTLLPNSSTSPHLMLLHYALSPYLPVC